jgi:hypothetical protein
MSLFLCFYSFNVVISVLLGHFKVLPHKFSKHFYSERFNKMIKEIQIRVIAYNVFISLFNANVENSIGCIFRHHERKRDAINIVN